MERRALESAVVSKGRTLYGYAARFNEPTDLGVFTEVIRPGAFQRSLASDEAQRIRAIYEHDARSLLGRLGSGTLRLWEDEKGLAFEVDLPDTQLGKDLAVLVERGDVAGCSFAFYPQAVEWDGDTRHLTDVNLDEITITANPAYDVTNVDVRGKQPQSVKLARLYLEACR
ncbi:HK97 family phage prohead protease [Marinobacter sp.]|jgi:hypothetical protein|uniref:HK97 family phage prohead protease n=1 Tax=Marinobacter sp. TaxID=50741 RepID=UPI000C68C830|nr:HK97 family phage prohead protease [Marinobacter sp.]MAO13718.1 HK97 family phage prohead protease [Marinobacter sp.]